MQISAPQPIYIIGDVHGHLKKLVKLLQDVQLINDQHSWKAGRTTLWFIGDLVDRGPDSIAVLDLVMGCRLKLLPLVVLCHRCW